MGNSQSGDGDAGAVGDILSQLSPRMGEMMTDTLNNEVEPVVDSALSDGKREHKFNFTKVEFGEKRPDLTNIKVHKAKDGVAKKIIMDFDLEYLGDSNIEVSLLGIRSGVRNIHIVGKGRVVLTPTMKSLPLVGGIQFFFLHIPNIDFEFEGLANIADLPILKDKIRKSIEKDMCKKIVFPSRLVVPLSHSCDPSLIHCSDMTGLLGVKVCSVSNLPTKGGARGGMRAVFGQASPDPYCKVSVGSTKFRTSVVKNSTDAEWDEWFEFPLEVQRGSYVELRVYDEDSLSRDEFMGRALIKVDEHLGAGPMAAFLEPLDGKKTKYQIAGEVTVEMSWIPLVVSPGGARLFPGTTEAVLTVFLYSAHNLMDAEGGAPNVGVAVAVGEDARQSKVMDNSPQPEFMEEFLFMLGEDWADKQIAVDVNNQTDGSSFGSVNIGLSDLVENDMRRKLLSLSEDNPQQTITLAAWIRFPGE